MERLYPFADAGKIQMIRSKGQLLSEEYLPEGIQIKAYVPQDVYGKTLNEIHFVKMTGAVKMNDSLIR